MTQNKLAALLEALKEDEWEGMPPYERQTALQRYFYAIDRKKGRLDQRIKAKEAELDILNAEAAGYNQQGAVISNHIAVYDEDFNGGINLSF